MNRSKIVAILTGAFSILLAVAYLILVQLLDYRGEMKPAPVGMLNHPQIIQTVVFSVVENRFMGFIYTTL